LLKPEVKQKTSASLERNIPRSKHPQGFSANLQHTWLLVNQPCSYTAWLREHYGQSVCLNRPGEVFVIALSPEAASQMLSPAFHPHNFRGYGDVIRQVTLRHTEKWETRKTLRAIDTILGISLEVTMRMVFGVQDDPFVERGRHFLYKLWHNIKIHRDELAPPGPDPDIGALVKAPYLSAVCNETVRLHTLLLEVGRMLISPLEVWGYTLRARAWVGVSIMAIHNDPELYPEPDRNNPARFIGLTYNPYEFMPLDSGQRGCLGSGLSDFEMRIAMAQIVMNWEFEPATAEVEVRHDIAMGLKHGVRMCINSRHSPQVFI
jgi:cytochrome P450